MTETEAKAMAREWWKASEASAFVAYNADNTNAAAAENSDITSLAALILSVDASARKDGFHEGWREAMRPSG